MPAGLDTHQIINERERFIEARIQQRIRELEAMPATMADGIFDPNDVTADDRREDKENFNTSATTLESLKPYSALIHPSSIVHGKLRAVIELKSLRLLDKQRALCASVAERLTHGRMLPLNRLDFRRVRKSTIRDVRMTEQLEWKQRLERSAGLNTNMLSSSMPYAFMAGISLPPIALRRRESYDWAVQYLLSTLRLIRRSRNASRGWQRSVCVLWRQMTKRLTWSLSTPLRTPESPTFLDRQTHISTLLPRLNRASMATLSLNTALRRRMDLLLSQYLVNKWIRSQDAIL